MTNAEPLGYMGVNHPLYVTSANFVLRLKDKGVTAGPDALVVRRNGGTVSYPYSSIVDVNLLLSAIPRVGYMTQMIIRFRDGKRLRILNTDAGGTPDADQTQHYYRFKADFHQRLVASGAASNITFTSGYSPGRARVVKVIMAIAAAFFVGTPIIIFAMTGEAEALLICLAGLAFVVPFFRVSQRNAPQRYDPRSPPDMLD